MLGHYILTLCPEAEHDILTGKMEPGDYGTDTERCLVGWAAGLANDDAFHGRLAARPQHTRTKWIGEPPGASGSVESVYDALCERFGAARVNVAIRNRILQNIARRTLQQEGVAA